MKRESFVFYQSFWNATKTLPKENQKNALVMMIEYWIDWIEPTSEIDGIAFAIFQMAKPQIDINNKKFKIWSKQWCHWIKGKEYGKLWWRPKKENPPPLNIKPPNNPPNVNVNDNVNDNDNEIKNNNIKRKFLDFVMMSNEENNKLLESYWNRNVKIFIERLNNYIGSTGKRYKSHYFTILNWMKKEQIKSYTDKPKPIQAVATPHKEMSEEDKVKAKEMLDKAHKMFLSK